MILLVMLDGTTFAPEPWPSRRCWSQQAGITETSITDPRTFRIRLAVRATVRELGFQFYRSGANPPTITIVSDEEQSASAVVPRTSDYAPVFARIPPITGTIFFITLTPAAGTEVGLCQATLE